MKRPEDGQDEERFIWVKKQRLEEQKGLTSIEIERLEAERRERNKREIEKLERQRLEWEAEKERKQAEKEKNQLDKEKDMLGDWQEKERRFHLDQAHAKAEVHIKSGRSDLFDWIILNTCNNPDITTLFDGSTVELIEFGMTEDINNGELIERLEEHLELEKDTDNINYLNSVLVFIENDTETSNRNSASQLEIVKEEVVSLLSGKTASELTNLEASIQEKLRKPGLHNRDFWAEVLTSLVVFRRKALVNETSRLIIDRRKGKLGERALCLTVEDWKIGGETPLATSASLAPTPCPSPLVQEATNWDDDPRSLEMYEQEQDRKVSKDEIPYNAEAEDLIQPRIEGLVRPRYFNRVKTCFEWNKYNQTHYDADNPPPKSVQGYRFNVFYPQLAAEAKSPTYRVEEDPHLPEMKIIRFFAGPPYEDLVFRIDGEEWDMSHRQGFNCTFEAGILSLDFWFKSQRYRR